MIISIDMGASAIKLCEMQGNNIVFTHYESAGDMDVSALTKRLGIELDKAEAVVLTGLSCRKSGLEGKGYNLKYVQEPDAIGAGAVWLSGRDNILVTSIGTGTAFVLAREGKYKHLCGSGVGGGTLKGLAVRVTGESDMCKFNRMALSGSAGSVDLLIGDFVESYGLLDPEVTASNLARLNPGASNEDWAAGITNLVLQSLGTMSLLACMGQGASCVVVTGAMAASEPARINFDFFTKMYGVEFIIPPHCECATAIGAARLISCS